MHIQIGCLPQSTRINRPRAIAHYRHHGDREMKAMIRRLEAAALALFIGSALGASPVSQQRFDSLVRDDFFAGLGGDTKRFEQAMKTIDDALKESPDNPKVAVWHGAGLYFQSASAFARNDVETG